MGRSVTINSSALRAAVMEYGQQLHHDTLEDLLQQAWDQAPVDTGATRDYLRISGEMVAGSQIWGRVESPTPQAKYQDEGTRPHEIRGNPLLAFQWHGRTVIVRSVHHPGSTHYRGWFSDVMTTENYTETLRRVIAGITLAA